MSLRAAVALAVAAVALSSPAVAAAPRPGNAAAPPADLAPVCGSPAATGFPVDSRLHGGPSGYPTGLPSSGFTLDLTNVTDSACTDVHPLIILVDRDGRLAPGDFTLRYAFPGRPWRTMPFETSDHGENIGIPGGPDGPGLTLPAGGTATVRLQLRFAADAPAEHVVASATAMQRRGDNGTWVAESNHYAFDVVPPPGQSAAPGADAVGGSAPGPGSEPVTGPAAGAGPALADTGTAVRPRAAALYRLGALAAGLIAAGALLVAVGRRRVPVRSRHSPRPRE